MKKEFMKMHGLGNDFAIFDGRYDGFRLSATQIQALGCRRRGIGFDQIVIIGPENTMKIYNADGGEVGACGNATRCVASMLMSESGQKEIVLTTVAGQLACWREGEKVGVDMGAAKLSWQDIPVSNAVDTLSVPLTIGNLSYPVAVNVGNPHAVFFVPSVESVPLEVLGPQIEYHPLFPSRMNVEVAEVLSRDQIRMRVWERGVGITPACGTGACAVAVAGVRRGLTERRVEVILDGGALDIEWRAADQHVLMIGPTSFVYKGEVDV